MKCTNCKRKIEKHNTICTSCRNRTNWTDIGDASVGLAFFWLISMFIAFAISSGIAGAIGPNTEAAENFIITIIPLIWVGILYAILFWMLGPESMYTCEKCTTKNDGPMYFCTACGKLNVNKGVGNHLIGVFIGFSMILLFFVLLEEYLGDGGSVLCYVGLVVAVGASVGLFIPIGKYKSALLKVETRLPDIQRRMYEQQTTQFKQFPYPYSNRPDAPMHRPPPTNPEAYFPSQPPPPPPEGQHHYDPPTPPPPPQGQQYQDAPIPPPSPPSGHQYQYPPPPPPPPRGHPPGNEEEQTATVSTDNEAPTQHARKELDEVPWE